LTYVNSCRSVELQRAALKKGKLGSSLLSRRGRAVSAARQDAADPPCPEYGKAELVSLAHNQASPAAALTAVKGSIAAVG
jgi:hypothetical protein